MRYLLCCIALIGMLLPAYNQDYRIVHWGVDEGLSQGTNQKIRKDKKGFLWITSYEGLNRFDGKSFKSFYNFPSKRNAIRGTETTGIVQDSLYNIWIGSGDGLNRYDPVADSMICFLPEAKSNTQHYFIPLAATQHEVVCYDIAGQITAFDIHNLKRRLICSNIPWHDDYLNATNNRLDKKNNILWMPAQMGLLRIELSSGHTSTWFGEQKINAVVYNEQKKTMISGTNDGYIEWNEPANEIRYIKKLGSQQLHKITCLATDIKNNLWIGTEEHGIFIAGNDNSVTRIIKDAYRQNSINGNKINCLYCDSSGITWAGVATNGINQLIPGNRFDHYSENYAVTNNLNNNIVRCFLEDSKKNIWIATQGGGINIFDPQKKSFSSLTQQSTPGLPFDFIRFMINEDDDALVGTEKGMCRINTQTFSIQKIQFINSNDQPVYNSYIEQITAFKNNSWLIATKEGGLYSLEKKAVRAKQLPFPGNKHVFYTAFVNNLLFMSLWDGAQKIFDTGSEKWVEVKKDISSFLITYVLFNGDKKRFYIGTLKGLLVADADLNILQHYTTADGLSNNYIYAMMQDRNQMIWISTNKELSFFDPETGSFIVYTPADGLQGYEYNAKAVLPGSDGAIYFGGTNGFDIIKPSTSSLIPAQPVCYIKNILVNNTAVEQNKDINQVTAIQLPYTSNNVTIQPGIIDFAANDKSKIRYRLAGADTGWKTAERDFVINYSGLPPGNYVFTATASNSNAYWRDIQTTLNITIQKPWW